MPQILNKMLWGELGVAEAARLPRVSKGQGWRPVAANYGGDILTFRARFLKRYWKDAVPSYRWSRLTFPCLFR